MLYLSSTKSSLYESTMLVKIMFTLKKIKRVWLPSAVFIVMSVCLKLLQNKLLGRIQDYLSMLKVKVMLERFHP